MIKVHCDYCDTALGDWKQDAGVSVWTGRPNEFRANEPLQFCNWGCVSLWANQKDVESVTRAVK